MAEFDRLPVPIQEAAKTHMAPDEQVLFCFVAGTRTFASGDYVVITSARLLMLDERIIGNLGASYVNVQCDLPFESIDSIEIERSPRQRLLRQMLIKIAVDDRTHLIHNVSYRQGRHAVELMRKLREMAHE